MKGKLVVNSHLGPFNFITCYREGLSSCHILETTPRPTSNQYCSVRQRISTSFYLVIIGALFCRMGVQHLNEVCHFELFDVGRKW